MPIYIKGVENGVRTDSPSALCLIVLALGKNASNLHSTNKVKDDDVTGIEYYSAAYQIAMIQWVADF